MQFMKKAVLLAGLCLLTATSAANAATKVAFVTAEGGLGDLSFNDMIAEGLSKAKKDLGVEYAVIQPRSVADFQSSLVRAAGQGERVAGRGPVDADEAR